MKTMAPIILSIRYFVNRKKKLYGVKGYIIFCVSSLGD